VAIRLSAAAQYDLVKIALDGLEKFGPYQVERYEAGLNKLMDQLAHNPNMAAEHTQYDPPVRMFPYQSHIILFRVDDGDIFVLRICHAREDWTRL
jgi:toxin ParE1/3/4